MATRKTHARRSSFDTKYHITRQREFLRWIKVKVKDAGHWTRSLSSTTLSLSRLIKLSFVVHTGGRWPLTELTEGVMLGCVTWWRRLSKNLPNQPCRGSLVGADASTARMTGTTDWKRREDVTRHDTRTYMCVTHVHTDTPVYVCVNSHARTRVLHTYTLTHTCVRVC